MGRNPAPKGLKVLRGDPVARINMNEPEPGDLQCPSAPSWCTQGAKSLWKRLAPDLHAKKVLTWWDRDAFAVLLEAFVTHREATKLIQEHGLLPNGPEGNRNPAITIQQIAAQEILSYSSRFGLTPSDRSKLIVDKVEVDEDDVQRLMA
jgi:P27 family predicted phage terminase small subunit